MSVEETRPPYDLKERTRLFALRTIRLVSALPKSDTGRIIGKQLLRSSTSVGANYRGASLAQSKPAFIAKLSIVLEEADECCYWLDLIMESGLLTRDKSQELYSEAVGLTKIFASARISARD